MKDAQQTERTKNPIETGIQRELTVGDYVAAGTAGLITAIAFPGVLVAGSLGIDILALLPEKKKAQKKQDSTNLPNIQDQTKLTQEKVTAVHATMFYDEKTPVNPVVTKAEEENFDWRNEW